MSIPASTIVSVTPGVISAGGNALSLNGLFLTQNGLMPTAKVFAFVSAKAVGTFFGYSSDEYALASIYFAGYANSLLKPNLMLFAPYVNATRSAFLTSGSLAGMSLAALKALTGVLTITVDGTAKTSSTINLSSATSFSNAATIIAAAFTNGPVVTWNPVNSTFVFTSTTSGPSSTISYATGTLASPLSLGQSQGAVTSQGAAVDTPATAMQTAVSNAQNFATFTTMWEPDLPTKQAFANWSAAQNSRLLYVAWDSDPNASIQGNTTSFGYLLNQADTDGVIVIGGDPVLASTQGTTLAITTRNVAAFVCGMVACIDFTQRNGRITGAFKSSGLIQTTCEDQQLANNLLTNGYNFYGAYATANQGFVFFNNGQLPGPWAWLDTFADQVFLNSQIQLALMTLLTSAGSIAYNAQGYGLIRSAITGGPIAAALNFGAIRTGVNLSATQIALVNQQAGTQIDNILSTLGFYLQILDPGASARQARQTPIVNIWYTDGSSVQHINLASTDLL